MLISYICVAKSYAESYVKEQKTKNSLNIVIQLLINLPQTNSFHCIYTHKHSRIFRESATFQIYAVTHIIS